MGYTHYWYTDQELNQDNFNKVVNDFKQVIPILEHLGVKIADGHGQGEPEINANEIRFNGLEKCGHTKRELGLTWPSDKAQGVANLSKQHMQGNQTFASVDGNWFAGLTLNERTCDGRCDYETFSIERVTELKNYDVGKRVFNCCKTAYRPYDLAVNVCLIIAKHHLKNQIIVHSDGELEQWKDAIEICDHFLGYGSEFNFDPSIEEIEKAEEALKQKEGSVEIDMLKPVGIGDIFYNSWGYDQTNVDFYKVVALTKSGKSAKVIKIGQTIVKQTGFMCENVIPDPDKIISNEVKTYRIGKWHDKIEIGRFWRWDGKPCYQSHYH